MLGVQTHLQAQELVSQTSVITIKPRFMLVNRLNAPVQFYATQHHGAAADAPTLYDVLRPTSGPGRAAAAAAAAARRASWREGAVWMEEEEVVHLTYDLGEVDL